MDKLTDQLDYVLNIDKFQKIQDDMAAATDTAVITIDIQGNPVTKHSNCSEFCTKVRADPKLGKLCEKCDSRGGLDAAREHKPNIYICHIGVVDFAIPIIFQNKYLGAIMAGQILLDKTNNNELEVIVSKKSQTDINEYPNLKELYNKLPYMSLNKINSIAQMINHLSNYIIEEAILKTSIYEQNHMESDNKHGYKYSLLKPAIEYINSNFREKIYIDDMAYRCNLSSGYFSKVFKREIGETFSSYVNRVKLEESKKLLKTTDSPIGNISLDLGFEESGYYIKVFKKYYGTTPQQYRNSKNIT